MRMQLKSVFALLVAVSALFVSSTTLAANHCKLFNLSGQEIGAAQESYMPHSLIGRYNSNVDAYDTQGAFAFDNGGGSVLGNAMVLGNVKYVTAIGVIDIKGQLFDDPLRGNQHYLGRVDAPNKQIFNAYNQLVATYTGCDSLTVIQQGKVVGAAAIVLILWDRRVHQRGDGWVDIQPAFM